MIIINEKESPIQGNTCTGGGQGIIVGKTDNTVEGNTCN